MTAKHFLANPIGRDFVVGDIHGCTAMVRALLEKAGFDPDRDRVFCVGDLIDRGPDSEGAIALIDEPWFACCMGNHEAMALDAFAGSDSAANIWMANGGRWAAGHNDASLEAIEKKLRALPMAISVGEGPSRFNLLHAEFFGTDTELDGGPWSDHTLMTMLWGRSLISGHFDQATQDDLSLTYVGHTVRDQVERVARHVYIDTGAFMAQGRLTMVEPATGREWVQEHVG